MKSTTIILIKKVCLFRFMCKLTVRLKIVVPDSLYALPQTRQLKCVSIIERMKVLHQNEGQKKVRTLMMQKSNGQI